MILLLLALSAIPDEDCALSRDAMHGIFDATRIQQHTLAKEDRRVVETGFVDGRWTRYTVGGCAHYAWTFTFRLKPGELESASSVHALALELLASLPTTDATNVKAMSDALRASGALQLKLMRAATITLPLKCGEYINCDLTTSTTELVLSYDYPM